MAAIVAEQELITACQVLFGLDLQVSRGFLEYLQMSGIKSAYRKKALETHPDLAIGRGEFKKRRNADLFCSVQQAYENLSNYLQAREKGYALRDNGRPRTRYGGKPGRAGMKAGRRGPAPGGRPNRTRRREENLYQGPLPRRRLLLGHYLYYSGIISWQTMIKALVWQRSQRPRLGEIGCRLGWLTDRDIVAILRSRKLYRSFGQSAIQMGLLTQFQLDSILLRQKRLQKKFGEFFVHHKILTPARLNGLIVRYNTHNAALEKPSFGSGYRF